MKTNSTYQTALGGFTLIELMIVVAIIGLFVTIAIPNLMNYQCKAKQSEAKSYLGYIRTAQETYLSEFGTYAKSLSAIGFTPTLDDEYSYSIINTSFGGYTIQASGTIIRKADIWHMTENGSLINIQPGC